MDYLGAYIDGEIKLIIVLYKNENKWWVTKFSLNVPKIWV